MNDGRGKESGRTFSATVRSSRVSRARYTSPMPPGIRQKRFDGRRKAVGGEPSGTRTNPLTRSICAVVFTLLAIATLSRAQDNWNTPQDPFRIFGNTYYIGTAGLSSILITSDAGHIVIDGALPQSARLIEANIRALTLRRDRLCRQHDAGLRRGLPVYGRRQASVDCRCVSTEHRASGGAAV